jgi:hypothetical protein
VTSTQSLLYCAQSDVTIERIRDLVEQVGPEVPTVEYKAVMSQGIAKAVAALANTYGGLVLVGVTDDRVVKGVKEKTIEAVAEHCHGKIEPPWIPEIVPVPMDDDSGLYVLVLRVVPGHAPRPLLIEGAAPVRHQNTTHPADWQRLRALFTETALGEESQPWNIVHPDIPRRPDGSLDEGVDFVLRSGFNVTVDSEAQWRPLPEQAVTALIDNLNESPLTAILPGLLNVDGWSINRFQRRGLNRSRTVRMEWQVYPDGWSPANPIPIEAHVIAEVPGGYGHTATHLRFTLDVTVRITGWVAAARGDGWNLAWQVSVSQLAELLDAIAATLTRPDITGPLSDLAGIDRIAVPQPRVLHFVTARPVTDVVETNGLRQIPDAGPSHGGHVLANPALDLYDSGDRQEQTQAWLVQLALDAGLLGMERLLKSRP